MTRVVIDRSHEKCPICECLVQALYSDLVYYGITGPRTSGICEGDDYHRVTVSRDFVHA